MNLENESDESLNRPQRKLSHFMAQEMLFDYISGRLDGDRKAALETIIQESTEVRNDLKLLIEAEKYAEVLSQTRLSPKYIDELQQVRSFTEKFILKLKWQNWPEFLKWSAEAFSVSAVIAITAIMVPWDKIDFSKIRFQRSRIVEVAAPPKKPEAPVATVVVAKTEPDKTSPEKMPPSNTAPDKKSVTKVAEKAPQVAVSVASAPAAPTVTTTPSTIAGTATQISSGSNQTIKKMMGLLYRVMLDTAEGNKKAAEIRNKIIALGGVKAGQVDLGWRKKDPDGNYYHFTMPEANYQNLITTLGGYGPVRIYKNPHERVMPEGQIRIILWVEDKSANPAASSATSSPTSDSAAEEP